PGWGRCRAVRSRAVVVLSEKTRLLGFDDAIAFTGRLPQRLLVQDFDVPAAIADHPACCSACATMETALRWTPSIRASNSCVIGSASPCDSSCAQQPPRQALFHGMRGVAGDRLLRLRKQRLLVRGKQLAPGDTFIRDHLEVRDREDRC